MVLPPPCIHTYQCHTYILLTSVKCFCTSNIKLSPFLHFFFFSPVSLSLDLFLLRWVMQLQLWTISRHTSAARVGFLLSVRSLQSTVPYRTYLIPPPTLPSHTSSLWALSGASNTVYDASNTVYAYTCALTMLFHHGYPSRELDCKCVLVCIA